MGQRVVSFIYLPLLLLFSDIMSMEEIIRRGREEFPEVNEMDVLLTKLLRTKATDPESAIEVEGPVERAMQLGYLAQSNGYYLTELGKRAAEITLMMYPKLGEKE